MQPSRTALVTGGITATTLAIAGKLEAEGCRVFIAGSNDSIAANTAGAWPHCIVADPNDESAIQQALQNVSEAAVIGGCLDVLVTVAEGSYDGSAANIDAARIAAASAQILAAPMLYTKAALPFLRQARDPAIVHVAPVSAFMLETNVLGPVLNNALVNYSRQCVPQLPGIRINAACPGGDTTTPEGVAALVAFMASPRGSYLNSAVVTVDGGWYATHPRAMPQ